MAGVEQRPICGGVNFRSIKDTRFKTSMVSVHFLLPLREGTAAANAILPMLLSRACREYPDFTKMEERLAELYGARISADVQKLGDVQVLTLTASCLADRYALEGEKLGSELSGLLCGIIFDPLLEENGLFPLDGFRQEKRQLLETVDAELNDKRLYAKRRCEQVMCAGEPYGINRYGSREQISALERETLTGAWENMIKCARVEIMALGDCDPDAVLASFSAAFAKAGRGEIADCGTETVKTASEVNRLTEEMDVAQGKLVMGFRAGTAIPDSEVPAAKLMCALFGGTPSSKLFLNVREKLGLCYYCSSDYSSMKGLLTVQSGVEMVNMEQTEKEILNQLEAIKRGDFTDEDIEAAKLSLCNSYRTLSDYLSSLNSWYLSQTFMNKNQLPEEAAEEIRAVTREQIVAAAGRVTLDTVYRLAGNGEDAE